MEKGKHRDLILELQHDRVRLDWSYQYICDELEKRGMPVSMTTIRRIFSAGGENLAYNYLTSLRPLSILFYETDRPTPERKPGDEEQAVEFREQVAGLKATLLSKNEYISALDRQIEHLENQKNEFKSAVSKRDKTIHFSRKVLMIVLIISIILLATNIVTAAILIRSLL